MIKYKKIIDSFLVIFCFLVCIHSIHILWSFVSVPENDQGFILCNPECLVDNGSIQIGLSSIFSVSIINKVTGIENSPVELRNKIVRISAFMLFTLSATFLFWSTLEKYTYVLICLLILLLSRFPLLWLSKELFYSSFIFLSLALIIKRRNVWLVATLLSFVSFGRIEGALAAFLLFLYYLWTTKNNLFDINYFIKSILIYITIHMMWILPGIYFKGSLFLFPGVDYSFSSFSQHFASIVSQYQITKPAPNGWEHHRIYSASIFPDAHNLMDIITKYRHIYEQYVVLSIYIFLKKIFIIHNFLLVIPLFFLKQIKNLLTNYSPVVWGIAVILVSLLPAVFISYLHVRNLSRLYPIILLFCVYLIENHKQNEKESWFKLNSNFKDYTLAGYTFLFLHFIYQFYGYIIDTRKFPYEGPNYWGD